MEKKKSISTLKISMDVKKLLAYIVLQILFLVFLFINFRTFRDFFPIPKILESKIIGYSQYFAYPLYFDTFIFFIVILSPIVICLFIEKFIKWKK